MALLLLFFHSLQLTQKKTVLGALSCALTATCQAAPASPPPHYCVLLARLALLQDYLVRHLYIRANLSSFSTLYSPASCPLTPELQTKDAPTLQPYFLLLIPPPGWSLTRTLP